MKYRIGTEIRIWESDQDTLYFVQYRYKYSPFWITDKEFDFIQYFSYLIDAQRRAAQLRESWEIKKKTKKFYTLRFFNEV
jgi:hypothetical protein